VKISSSIFSALIVVAAIVGADAANAADLPIYTKAPVTVGAPVYNWTGFYVGASGGYAWSHDADIDLASVAGLVPGGIDAFAIASAQAIPLALNTQAQGFIYGGQAGYNYQSGRWVIGVEADLSGTNINGAATQNGTAPVVNYPIRNLSANTTATGEQKLDFFGTVRGRFGFTPTDALLVYATGGLAYGHVESSTATSDVPTNLAIGPAAGSASGTRAGLTVGGGLEWGFTPHWTLKTEYLYYDLGSLNYALSPNAITTPCCGVGTVGFVNTVAATHFAGSIVRAGINYRF
jgi:outer membrane immunogenic protein